jgi:hypothetical protein
MDMKRVQVKRARNPGKHDLPKPVRYREQGVSPVVTLINRRTIVKINSLASDEPLSMAFRNGA